MDGNTKKRLLARLKPDNGKGRELRGRGIGNTPYKVSIDRDPPESPNPPNPDRASENVDYKRVIQGIAVVCADPAHPRFLDATKLLVELKGWKGTEDKLTADKVEPSAFVQMVAKAMDTHRNVRSFLDAEVVPRIAKDVIKASSRKV